MRIAPKLALFLLISVSSRASAQKGLALVVERSAGAESCPDAEALIARIEQIRGRPEQPPASGYRVAFARKDDGFTAVISTGPGHANVRTLENAGPSCSPLANAAALTLALLFDSDVSTKPAPEAAPSPPAPVAVAPVAPAVPPKASPPRHAVLAIGVAGLAAVLRPVSPALTAEGGIAGAHWRVSVGALWALPQNISLPPGTVREELVTGIARGCWKPWSNESLRFHACSGVMAGAVTAEGQGYSNDERRTRAWVAVPVELTLATWTAPVGWELGAHALVLLQRHDFSVDGVGVAYRSPPVAAMLSLRVLGLWRW